MPVSNDLRCFGVLVALAGCGGPAKPSPLPVPAVTAPAPAPLVALPEPALVLQRAPARFDVLALDPRGALLAVADADRIAVLRASDRSVVARLGGFDSDVIEVSFGAGGRTLFGWSRSGKARLWDVEQDALIAEIELQSGAPRSFALNEDATYAALFHDEGVHVLDLRTGKLALRRSLTGAAAHTRLNGRHLTTTVGDRVEVFDLEGRRVIGSVPLGGCAEHRALPRGDAILLNRCPRHEVHLVDVATGHVRWQRTLLTSLADKHIAVAADRIIGHSDSDLVDLTSGATIGRGVVAFALSADGAKALYVDAVGRAVLHDGTPHPLGEVSHPVAFVGFDGEVPVVHTAEGVFWWDPRTHSLAGRVGSGDVLSSEVTPNGYVWVQCDGRPGRDCASASWHRREGGPADVWTIEGDTGAYAQPVIDSAALLLMCRGGDPRLLTEDGSLLPVALPDDVTVSSARMSPDQARLAIETAQGTFIWDRATSLVTTVPPLAEHPDDLVPTVRWAPDGKAFMTYRPNLPMEEAPVPVAFYRDVDGGAPVRFEPSHSWIDVTWHPTEPVVFLNSRWGSMFNLSWWAGSSVSVYRLDGTSLGELDGHTVSFSPSGELLLLYRNHPSRSTAPALTQFMDPKSRRPLFSLPGFVEAWAEDESWFVMREESRSDSNAPGGPSTFTLYVTATGKRKGSVTTYHPIMVERSAAELVSIEEQWESGATRHLASRWNMMTGAQVGSPTILPPDHPFVLAQWQSAGEVIPHGSALRVVGAEREAYVDLYVHPPTSPGSPECRWLLIDSSGRLDGDLAGAFAVRAARDLRRAPLTSGDALAESRRAPQLYRDFVEARK